MNLGIEAGFRSTQDPPAEKKSNLDERFHEAMDGFDFRNLEDDDWKSYSPDDPAMDQDNFQWVREVSKNGTLVHDDMRRKNRETVYCSISLPEGCEGLELLGRVDVVPSETHPTGLEKLGHAFFLRAEDEYVRLNVKLNFTKDPVLATTLIERRNTGSKQLPGGAGGALYTQGLQFIQGMADRLQMPIKHLVIKSPRSHISKEGEHVKRASREEWDEKFLPLLNADGRSYTPHEDHGAYEYVYQPRPLSKEFIPGEAPEEDSSTSKG